MKAAALLWKDLQDAGIVSGEMPEIKLESPWYVRLMLGVTGWISGLFFLLFLVIAFDDLFENAAAEIIISFLLFAVSFFLLRAKKNNDFLEQLALAFSFAGQILFIIGTAQLLEDSEKSLFFIIIALFQSALTFIMPNPIHRLVSSFAAGVSLSYGFYAGGLPGVSIPLLLAAISSLWLQEEKWMKHHSIFSPAATGLTLSVIFLQGSRFLNAEILREINGSAPKGVLISPYSGEILSGIIFIAVVYFILEKLEIDIFSPVSAAALFFALLFSAASLIASGLVTGLTVILLGFRTENRILTGLGIFATGYYISSYYYMLNTTLLQKSMTLFAGGAVLLLARWAILFLLKNQTEAEQ